MAKYEIEWAVCDYGPTGEGRWQISEEGRQLLADGWEPFTLSLQSTYWPTEPGQLDILRERMWFKRRKRWWRR